MVNGRLTAFDTTSYASKDFVNWYSIGKQPGFSAGECPSFFKLLEPFASETQNVRIPRFFPPTCISFRFRMAAGTGCKSELGEMVRRGNPGKWTKIGDKSIIDSGNFYASKDFHDPVKNRRINFGWAVVSPGSTLSLGREVIYNVDLQQLEFAPLEEQKSLRSIQLATMSLQSKLMFWKGGELEHVKRMG